MCVTVNIICKILYSSWMLVWQLEWCALQWTLSVRYFTMGGPWYFTLNKVCYSQHSGKIWGMKIGQIWQMNILVWCPLGDVMWTKLQISYYRLHHKACSETAQYSIPLLKSRYSFGLTKKWTRFKTPFFLSQEKHVQSLCSRGLGKSLHGEIISFILISTIETLYGNCLGCNILLLLFGITTVRRVSFSWTISMFNCRG